MYCQKCRTPLKLDGSLEDLNPAAFKLLTDSSAAPPQQLPTAARHRPAFPLDRRDEYDRVSENAKSPVSRRSLPYRTGYGMGASQIRGNPAMSFVMLTESQVAQPPDVPHIDTLGSPKNGGGRRASVSAGSRDSESLLSQKAETTARLFEILSARSDIDHPICVECTELLVDSLQKRFASATKERDAYVEYLRQANADIPTEEEQQQAQKELDRAQEQEKALFSELEKLEKAKAAVDDELRALDDEADRLDKDEEAFWMERNAFAAKLSEFQNEADCVNARYDHDAKQLQRLSRTNVYNDTFYIHHDGPFATINGLRLGRHTDRTVDWAEINAAWGQVCLLLATVADKLSFTFQGYRLNPMGSSSTIDKIEYPQSASSNDPSHPVRPRITTLELHSNGEYSLGFNFMQRRFDNGMVAFLECLRQLGEYVEAHPLPKVQDGKAGTLSAKLPYDIRKDRIGDQTGLVSIKLGTFSREEEWTKACKYTMTCCKHVLAYLSQKMQIQQEMQQGRT